MSDSTSAGTLTPSPLGIRYSPGYPARSRSCHHSRVAQLGDVVGRQPGGREQRVGVGRGRVACFVRRVRALHAREDRTDLTKLSVLTMVRIDVVTTRDELLVFQHLGDGEHWGDAGVG